MLQSVLVLLSIFASFNYQNDQNPIKDAIGKFIKKCSQGMCALGGTLFTIILYVLIAVNDEPKFENNPLQAWYTTLLVMQFVYLVIWLYSLKLK